MRLGQNLLQQGAAAGGLPVGDVFSTDLYTGNGSTQTITNGIDLLSEGGLVWIKSRTSTASHALFDTERGATNGISTNLTNPEVSDFGLTAFNSDGFTVSVGGFNVNSANNYAAWTFRKAPAFFDVVTYTGTASTPVAVNHSLGVVPGLIVMKQYDGNRDWLTWHRSLPAASLALNRTDGPFGNQFAETPTATDFTLAAFVGANQSGNYVAYVFAHDETPSGLVRCGSYTGNGSATGPVIDLGWEPQWLLVKRTDSAGDWWMYDSARSPSNPRVNKLLTNSSAVEDTAGEDVDFISTGFQPKTTAAGINASGGNYVYVAIRA